MIMNKKQYIFPLTEVMTIGADVMQHLNPLSKTEFPGGPAGVPFNPRRTEVF